MFMRRYHFSNLWAADAFVSEFCITKSEIRLRVAPRFSLTL